MIKSSTLRLLEILLKEKDLEFERSVYKTCSKTKLEPQKKIINNILSYASSVKGIEMKSGDKILISLN
tara:strand:- start:218 stop:421 length:204 start_codon:yes stop_codon:yes gene_type:complete